MIHEHQEHHTGHDQAPSQDIRRIHHDRWTAVYRRSHRDAFSGSFTGTEGDVAVTGTPAGTVSQPTFTGSKAQIAGTTTAAGSVSQPTFTGTQGNVSVS